MRFSRCLMQLQVWVPCPASQWVSVLGMDMPFCQMWCRGGSVVWARASAGPDCCACLSRAAVVWQRSGVFETVLAAGLRLEHVVVFDHLAGRKVKGKAGSAWMIGLGGSASVHGSLETGWGRVSCWGMHVPVVQRLWDTGPSCQGLVQVVSVGNTSSGGLVSGGHKQVEPVDIGPVGTGAVGTVDHSSSLVPAVPPQGREGMQPS